jgi:hypothetical protein
MREYVASTEAAWRDGIGAFFAVADCAGGGLVGSIALHVLDPKLANVEVGS